MSSRLSTSAASRSSDSSAAWSSSSRSSASRSTSRLRRLVTAALADGERGAEVVADGGEQRGAHLSASASGAGLGGGLG